jgi:glycine/D-amino acid oxidase-like deaminating enzyme
MRALVHPDSLHFERPVESWWEASADPLNLALGPLATDEACDVAIIGGGFTGLSAAIELAQSGVDVRLLEAGHVAWGASGRNGGFACVGSHKLPYPTMIKRYGLQATQHFYRTMKDSVALVAENCARFGIDAEINGEGEVELAHLPNRMAEFRRDQEFLHDTFGEDKTLLSNSDLKVRGLVGPEFHGGLLGKTGFGVHPLNYARGLARAAHKLGAKLHPHSAVIRWEETSDGHVLHTKQGRLRAKRVLVATNGYTPEDVSTRHAGRILPALSNIIVTRVLTESERMAQGWTSSTMAYDARILLHYFRLLPDNRFLFGSRGGTDSSNASMNESRTTIIRDFQRMFPAWANVEITHSWRGHVCLTADRVPYVGTLDERKSVWTALAYHGNGVAMGSWCGRAVARFMLNEKARGDIPTVITRRLAKFPLPAFRPLYLKGAYVWYGIKDAR